jgi:hypothetical protein
MIDTYLWKYTIFDKRDLGSRSIDKLTFCGNIQLIQKRLSFANLKL